MWTLCIKLVLWFGLLSGLAACQKPPTNAAQNFAAATAALAQAESDYFDQIQAASDASFKLANAFDYVNHQKTWREIAPNLAQRNDFSKAKALRIAALKQVQNYAQQLSAIATGIADPSLSDAAKSLVSNTSQLGQNAGILKISPSQLTLVQTAVTDLEQAIISNQAAHEFQSLAQQASKPIADIQTMIDADRSITDNTNYAPELANDQITAVTAILSVVYADPGVSTAERLAVYSDYNINWKPLVFTKGQDIATVMKNLKNANDAMKVNQPVAASAWAQQAYQLAKLAIATQPAKQ